MEWLILIVMLALFALGFIVMDKLDKFIASPLFFPDSGVINEDKGKSEGALVFGSLTLSHEIAKLLEKQNLPYTKIGNFNELNKSYSYQYLFAVDQLDLENLMICAISEKTMGISKRIAICNCVENKKIFEDNHIPYFCRDIITAPELVSTLYPSLANVGGNPDV